LPVSNGISYRKALQNDSQLILDMEGICFGKSDAFTFSQIHHFLKNPAGSIITDIIEYQNNPAGWAVYFKRKNSSIVRLYSICIVPEFSGRGIAQIYLSERINSFQNFKTIVLEVREGNKKAVYLYEKLGFKTIKKLKSYYPDNEDGLRMQRNTWI